MCIIRLAEPEARLPRARPKAGLWLWAQRLPKALPLARTDGYEARRERV